MPSVIQLKRSAAADAVPLVTDLVEGELAINVLSGRLYTRDDDNNVVNVGENLDSLSVDTSLSSATLAVSGAGSLDSLVVETAVVNASFTMTDASTLLMGSTGQLTWSISGNDILGVLAAGKNLVLRDTAGDDIFVVEEATGDTFVLEGEFTVLNGVSNLSGGVVALSSSLMHNTTVVSLSEGRVSTGTSGVITCDLGNSFALTPNGNKTYTFTNVPTRSNTSYGMTLSVSPSVASVLTWPASVKWPDGITPDDPFSGTTSIYTFFTEDNGTTWYGFLVGEGMA